jgi:hypothetical protein
MARMHPEYLSPTGRLGRRDTREPSDAERMVFEELGRQFDNQWDVYYSVWFRDTAPGQHAEADFALISAAGILLFEIKGGTVDRLADGQWRFRTKRGEVVDIRRRGPFDQVRDAWYAMKEHVRRTCGDAIADECVWGYGVITPECQVRAAGADPGEPRVLWLDAARFPGSLKEFVGEVLGYWKQDFGRYGRRGNVPRPLSAAERVSMEKALRPVVRCVLGAGVEAREIDRVMCRLTSEQYSILDHLQLDPRLVVQGGAGTGKTLIALLQAQRESSESRRVLYLCYNRLLADHIARDPRLRRVTVDTYHQFVFRLLREAGMTSSLPDDWSQINRLAPELVVAALVRLGDRFVPWDYLIVDEAQDLMTAEFISVLELIVKGGMRDGRWLLCLDTEQAIFSPQYDAQYLGTLVRTNDARRGLLPRNCRNTRQIAAYGHSIGGITPQSKSSIEGRMPAIDYYTDHAELRRKIRKCINRLVSEFRDAQLPESHITILIGRREPFEAMVLDDLHGCLAHGQLLGPGVTPVPTQVQVATIQAFKGLESDAVVVLGLDDLTEEWQRRLFYVASTRARAILEVLLPVSQQAPVTDVSGLVAAELMRSAGEDAGR